MLSDKGIRLLILRKFPSGWLRLALEPNGVYMTPEEGEVLRRRNRPLRPAA